MQKDKTILELLKWLQTKLGGAFHVTDHWEADLYVMRISAADDPEQLVYISSRKRPEGQYYVELKSAAGSKSAKNGRTVKKFASLEPRRFNRGNHKASSSGEITRLHEVFVWYVCYYATSVDRMFWDRRRQCIWIGYIDAILFGFPSYVVDDLIRSHTVSV